MTNSWCLACGQGGNGLAQDVLIALLICMGAPIVWGVVVTVLCSVFALSQRESSNFIAKLAQGYLRNHPLALFSVSLAMGVVPVGVVVWWLLPRAVLPLCGHIQGLLLVSGGILGGVWIAMLAHWLAHREELRASVEQNAAEGFVTDEPRKSVWLQDLVLAVLCYGFGVFVLTELPWFKGHDPHTLFYAGGYLLLAGAFGLYVALDVCGRSAWGQAAMLRAGVFVTLFFLFPLVLPMAYFAWKQWRKALKPKHFPPPQAGFR